MTGSKLPAVDICLMTFKFLEALAVKAVMLYVDTFSSIAAELVMTLYTEPGS